MNNIFKNLSNSQINRLFPFFLVIDANLMIERCGRSMVKLIPIEDNIHFNDYFKFSRPKIENPTFHDFILNEKQLVVLELIQPKQIKLRGQFEVVSDYILFIGSPWFEDINQLPEAGLTIFDFALHDSQIDLLQVLKNQEMITSDIQILLAKLRKQKKDLEDYALKLRKNQEQLELLSRIAEETVNSIMITNNRGTIEWVNHSFTKMSGYTLEEVIDKKPDEFLSGPETDQKILREIRWKVKKGEHFTAEILNYDKYGKSYWAKITGHPLKDKDGNITKYFTLKEDITAELEAERMLLEAKEKADAMALAKDAFLANMSHEMRTPLNAILGMSKQLVKSSLNDKQHFFLDTINSAAEHLLVVINDILDLSRIEAGKLNIENIDFDIRSIVSKCIQGLSPKAEEKGLDFSMSIDSRIAPVFVGDPYRLNQILLNLLSNSIKFTEKGSVKVRVTLNDECESNQCISIIVSDTGIGMDEKFLNNLFNKFTQEDSSIVRKYGGTGLGLSITKQLIEMMNGHIEVKSKKQVGTTFKVGLKFPIGNVENIAKEYKVEINNSILENVKVLVVEDNEMNRILAKTVLNNFKAQIYEVENGLKAVRFLQNETVDIILMDIQMPIMDGFEATRYIREELKLDMPIIALTANALKGEHIKCISAGMNAYLTKPFNEEDLILIMAELLHITPSVETRVNTGVIENVEIIEEKTVLKQENEAFTSFNLDYLNEMCGFNEDFVKSMIMAFFKEASLGIEQINGHIASDEAGGLKSTAHRLKSNLAMLNAHAMRDLAQKIEHDALASGVITPQLREEAARFNEGIKDILGQLEVQYGLLQEVT